MARCFGLDLGTSFVRLSAGNGDILLRCPSAAAIDAQSHETVAVGAEARGMLGKTPPDVLACRPIRGGFVSEFEATVRMLQALFRGAGLCAAFSRPSILLATPYRIDQVQQYAAENAVLEGGARAVAQIPSVFAAAAGAGLRVASPRGCMIMDMGGGLTEAAVISAGGIIAAVTVKAAGERFDAAIASYLRQRRNIVVGLRTAEALKLRIGVAGGDVRRGAMTVYGRHARTDLPAQLEVRDAEIREAVSPVLDAAARAALSALEELPPELAGDVGDYGLMLCGGCALMPGLPEALARRTRLRVTVARYPRDCAAIGLSRVIARPSLYGAPLAYRLK